MTRLFYAQNIAFVENFPIFSKILSNFFWGSLPPPKIGLKRSRDRPKIRKIPKIFKKIENFQNFKNLIFFKKYNNMDPKPLRNARYRSRTRPNPPEVVTCPTNKSEKFSKSSKKSKIFKISKILFFSKNTTIWIPNHSETTKSAQCGARIEITTMMLRETNAMIINNSVR